MKYYELTHRVTGEKSITTEDKIRSGKAILVPSGAGIETQRALDSNIITYSYNGQPFTPAFNEGLDLLSYKIKEIPYTPALDVLFNSNKK